MIGHGNIRGERPVQGYSNRGENPLEQAEEDFAFFRSEVLSLVYLTAEHYGPDVRLGEWDHL